MHLLVQLHIADLIDTETEFSEHVLLIGEGKLNIVQILN